MDGSMSGVSLVPSQSRTRRRDMGARRPARSPILRGRPPDYRRAMAMRHDEAFKFLFDMPEVCADALRVAAPALWPYLDPASVRILRAGDSVAADLSKRQGDALFAVDLREGAYDGALPDGRRPYLVVPSEFQSSDDAGMPDRVREYALRQLDTLRRQEVIPVADTPPVLPLVVYDGAAPWNVADGLEPLRYLPPEAALHLAPYQPQAYVLLDLVRSRTDDWGEYNRLRAVARLLRTRSPEELSAALAEEFARFAGPSHRPFREALHAWAGELWTRLADGGEWPTFAALEGLEASDMTSMIEVRFAAWKEEHFGRARAEGLAEGVAQGRAKGVAEGRAEGVAQGRAEGVAEGLRHQRAVLSRQATRRFGAAAGRAVAEAVAEMDEPVNLERIGDLIVDCPSARPFLLGLAEVAGRQEPVT